jgi:hypothetical protein
MYNQVIFYNHFGAGDVFESREFVKAWMKLVPAEEYYYSHGKNPRILLDIPELKFKDVTEHMNPMRGVWDDTNGNLYVNTWIGRDGKYVLPGIGCTVEKLYDMHNDMLKVYDLGVLPGEPIDYIPDIDYEKYDIQKVLDFIRATEGTERIYIDNGLVQSMQAENFDMNSIVLSLTEMHKDKLFICTQAFKNNRPNLEFVGEFAPGIGFDLNEASFLSLYCSTLIGRNSGPHVYTQVKRNVMDESKKLLSFTYKFSGSSFVVNTKVKIAKFWSDATNGLKVIEKIEEVLG